MASSLSWIPGWTQLNAGSSIEPDTSSANYSWPHDNTITREATLPEELELGDSATTHRFQSSSNAGESSTASKDSEPAHQVPVAKHQRYRVPGNNSKRKVSADRPAVDKQPAREQTMAPNPKSAAGPSVSATAPPTKSSKAPPQSNNDTVAQFCVIACIKGCSSD